MFGRRFCNKALVLSVGQVYKAHSPSARSATYFCPLKLCLAHTSANTNMKLPCLAPALCATIAAVVLLGNAHFRPTLSPPGTTYLEPSAQRPGDPAKGYEYLLYGNYVSSGIPLKIYRQGQHNSPLDLGRKGDSQGIPYSFNVVEHLPADTAGTAGRSTKLVVPNCLTCHAEMLNGQLVLGLGNNSADHTSYDDGSRFKVAALAIKLKYGKKSPEWSGFMPLDRSQESIGRLIVTQVRGLNPADKIFAALAAHRRTDDLSWLEKPQFNVPTEVVPTDVPAWWLMKKKNALYYNGLGRGDFARLSAASGMLTMRDSAEARRIDEHFPDVMAWIRSLEPPRYPYPIDAEQATAGKKIFEKNCSKCHGTYGDSVSYPNLLVALDKIGTDPLLSTTYQKYPEYHTWYNQSWYGQGPYRGILQPNDGYVAPPLDGIWATSPYLHNGSVPTLDDVLNSPQRPKYWTRKFDNSDYDPKKGGWRYTTETTQKDRETYDTTLPGYGNGGHRFGDKLSPAERQAVVEYLKTL